MTHLEIAAPLPFGRGNGTTLFVFAYSVTIGAIASIVSSPELQMEVVVP